jgi:DNA-binding transcriptional MocR family regulator
VGPRPVIERLAVIKRNSDLFANTLAQGATWQFLQMIGWSDYLTRLRTTYRQRRDIMVEALQRHGPEGLRWDVPAGGFYIWLGLPDGVLAQNVLTEAHQTGVSFLPGEPFCVDGGGRSSIRLNFSHAPLDRIDQGVRRLMHALSNVLKRRREGRAAAGAATRSII